MADMYDEMAEEEGETEDLEMAEEEASAEAEDIDETFKMLAERAGMDTPEKLEAFKMAIERCVELREANMYGGEEETEGEFEEV